MPISRPPPTGLGLRRGTVALAEYSPSWRVAFREERVILAKALASVPCEIEHIGSTAVPGLEAKPILDIAVGVGGSYPIEDCFPAIEATGYIYRGEVVDASHRVLVRGSEDQLVRTHHLHVVRLGDPNWERWLAFRDCLRYSRNAIRTRDLRGRKDQARDAAQGRPGARTRRERARSSAACLPRLYPETGLAA